MPSQTPSIFRCLPRRWTAGSPPLGGGTDAPRSPGRGEKLEPIVAKTTTSDAEAGAVISAKGTAAG